MVCSSASSSAPVHLQVAGRMRAQVQSDVEDRPRVQRTSFTSACGSRWKCMPRSVPARMLRPTLAWTQVGVEAVRRRTRPGTRRAPKKPRSSPIRSTSTMVTPSTGVVVNLTARSRRSAGPRPGRACGARRPPGAAGRAGATSSGTCRILVPAGDDHDRIGLLDRGGQVVDVGDVAEPGERLRPDDGVVGGDLGPGLEQRRSDGERGRVPHVVGVRLEGETEHGDAPPRQRAQPLGGPARPAGPAVGR